MNTKIRSFAFSLTACVIACVTGHAYEQDNWYLHGPIDGNLTGVFHQEYNATAKKDMLYKTVAGVGLEVRDINGTLLQTINTGGITFSDIEYDQNTSRLFGINANKLTCYEQNSSGGWSEQWRSTQGVSRVVQGPSGKLFCSNASSKIYTFEQNGTMSEFGWVDGINSMSDSYVVGVAPSGILVVNAVHNESGGSSKRRIFYFDENGAYINSIYSNYHDSTIQFIVMSPSGWVSFRGDGQFWKLYHPNGASLAHLGIEISLWLQNGDFISGSNLYRRTFRTKMETNHNSVPEPVIHRIAQRTGTNILELDFEVIDTDDDNVTVGILAYCGSDKLVPQSWLNGTGSKIGTPIATNTVHSMEWDVKQDWPDSTGSIKFEILCQDGSRDKPVDLHFLKLPFADGNMTISRSPLKDSDFKNYLKFLYSIGDLNSSFYIVPNGYYYDSDVSEGNATNPYLFTNLGQIGRYGPSQSHANSGYSGTSLASSVTIQNQGIQEWTVPATGIYTIEARGAQGGTQPEYNYGGRGALMKGEFQLQEGDKLLIAVGQKGLNTSHGDNEGGGGGGSFVAYGSDVSTAVPLIIAGGGGGDGSDSQGDMGRDTNTTNSNSNIGHGGGSSNGGGGFYSSATTNGIQGGGGFRQGLVGGQGDDGHGDGGFGGGSGGINEQGSSGGGYTGGYSSDSNGVGGAGSYNSGNEQENIAGYNYGNGSVRIASGRVSFDRKAQPVTNLFQGNNEVSLYVKNIILSELGIGYRFATPAEVTKAREAATPGGVNNWTATNQVKPRNLPGKVNEYGFDVSTTQGLWVIKE